MKLLDMINTLITDTMRNVFMNLRLYYSRIPNKNYSPLAACKIVQNELNCNISSGSIKEKSISSEDVLKKSSKRKKPPLTHFVSIPMNHDFIHNKVKDFKIDVINNVEKDSDNISEKLFQKPERLHLTIGMLTLDHEEKLEKAKRVLLDCYSDVISPFLKIKGPIKIQIKGVESLNNNPSKTRVLYAKITDELGHLQELSNNIVEYFVSHGIMEREYDAVKLHITLMNTTFRNREKKPCGKRYPFNFDATKIIETYKDTTFGEIMFNTLHISQRYKYTDDGYYFPTSKVDFFDVHVTEDNEAQDIEINKK